MRVPPLLQTFSGVALSSPFEEVASITADHNAAAADPWDDSVTVPTGLNRVILDLLTFQGTVGSVVSTLDPLGTPANLTRLQNPNAATEQVDSFVLLEAAMPAAGVKTLRANHAGVEAGPRQIITLRGARQTISSAQNTSAGTNTVTATATRSGGGNFPTGTIVYGMMMGNAAGTPITGVSGSIVEVRQANGSGTGNDRMVFGKGTLGAPAATVTATFTYQFNVLRMEAVVIAVEAA